MAKLVLSVDFKALEKKSKRAPILSYCRKLIKDGIDPETRLEVYRDGKEPDIIVPHIGKAAKLTIKEGDQGGPYFVKYFPTMKERGVVSK